jgi:integrase
MSKVKQRKWTTSKGEERSAWVVDYSDQNGDRHVKAFKRKKDADAYLTTVRHEVSQGTHTAPSQSITVAEAAENWLRHVELEGRERSTLDQYRQHANLHIVPRLGNHKLSLLTTPRINTFRDDLLGAISRPLARKVLVSVKSILKEAQRRGDVAQNVATSVTIGVDKRHQRRLEVGRDIPLPGEVKRILDAATGKWRALLVTAAFTGLRSSELRGLRWDKIDLKNRELHVRERADRYKAMGRPKSHSAERSIPMGPFLTNTLREWKLACPRSEDGLVFPTNRGHIYDHKNIVRAVCAIEVNAGVVKKGGPKYPGLHAFRHFFASWCANRKVDGGRELPIMAVKGLMGHASLALTSDLYSHLFPRNDDTAELAAAERALLDG